MVKSFYVSTVPLMFIMVLPPEVFRERNYILHFAVISKSNGTSIPYGQ